MKASEYARTPLTLISGPAGSGKTHLALELIRASATRSADHGDAVDFSAQTLLVLPTYAQVMHTKRLALSRWGARGILDAPFVTFTAAAERYLPSFRIHTLPTFEERDRFMAKALADVADPLFASLDDLPGLRERLLQWLKELKQSGLPLEQIAAEFVKASSALHESRAQSIASCMNVFRAYETRLHGAGLRDHEDMLRELSVSLAAQTQASVPSLLVVDGFDDLSPVECTIFEGLSDLVVNGGGRVVMTLPWDPRRPHLFRSSAATRARLLGFGFHESSLDGSRRSPHEPLRRIADRLFGDEHETGVDAAIADAPIAQAARHVFGIVGAGEADEAERIARVLRSAYAKQESHGIRGWRDVGIVLRQLDGRARAIGRALRRRGVPFRLVGRGEPLAASPWIRACRGPLSVLGGHTRAPTFDAHALNAWLHWCLSWHVDDAEVGEDTDPASRADLMWALRGYEFKQREGGAPPTFEDYRKRAPACLHARIDHLKEFAAACQSNEGSASVFEAFGIALLSLVPVPMGGAVSATGAIEDVQTDVAGAWAQAASRRLSTILESLARTAVRMGEEALLTRETVFAQVDEAIASSEVSRTDQRLDAVSILSVDDARFWELPFVVVAGLESGSFPRSPNEDLFLSDEERLALAATSSGLHLPTTAAKQDRERRLFYGAVTRAKNTLVVSRAGFDDKGAPRAASLFLDQLTALVKLIVITSPELDEHSTAPLHLCHTKDDIRQYATSMLAGSTRGVASTGTHESALIARSVALLKRSSPETLNAMLGAQGLRDPSRPVATPLFASEPGSEALRSFVNATHALSASALGKAVSCLHQFWYARVLRLPEDELSFEAPAFDARGIGSALHKAAEFAVRDSSATPTSIADNVLAYLKSRDHVVSDVDAHLLKGELVRVVLLLRDRIASAKHTPDVKGLERKFGYDEPATMGAVSLRGQIDRIDRHGNDVIVVDYKSGATTCDVAFKRTLATQDLQLPLYALALESLDAVNVVGMEWVALRERKRRIIAADTIASEADVRREGTKPEVRDRNAFREVLSSAKTRANNLITAIQAGKHTKNPIRKDTCATCAYVPICRFAEPDRVRESPTDEGAS